jgi:lysophospholipase L1-like esterase
MGLKIKDGDVFVFQGDSITDCGRRGADAPLGTGYAKMVVDKVVANHPALKVEFINEGIGGNTVMDLATRWEDDTIRLMPNWLSILIGINDLHRTLGSANPVPVDMYRESYDGILQRAVSACKPKIILLEPFYISADRSGASSRSEVLELLPGYIGVVHEMSKKYGTALVRTHEIFQEQIKHRPSDHFCGEPIHPNLAGHTVIAEALYRALVD